MARVPYNPVPDVAPADIPAPLLRVSATPAAFGTTVAQAIQHLGSTEEQVGGELATRAVAMQQLRNETEATDALSDLERKSGDLRVKYLDSRGKNAVDGYAGFRDANDSLRQSIRDGMSNPMAAKMFDRTALSVTNRSIIAGADHAASQNRQAAATSAQTAIDAAQDAAGYALDDKEFDTHLGIIKGRTQQLGDLAGLDKDSVDQLIFKNQSKAIANRIDQTARTDPVGARKMLDEAITNGRLHGQDRDRAENFVHSHLMSTGSRTFVDQNQKEFDDPETFLTKRRVGSGVHMQGVDQQFGQNLVAALSAAERATGSTARVESLARSYEEQARIRAEHEAMPGGVEAHPAAQPGTSRHEFGQAADLQSGPVLDWLRAKDANGQTNAEKFGLEFLPGKTGVNDPGHIQLAGGAPLRRVRAYDIPEKDYVEGAVGKMRESLPNAPPEMEERVRQEARQVYNRNAEYDRQQDRANVNTILETLQGNNPPQTVSDLLKVPGADNAWNQLPAKQQEELVKLMSRTRPSDLQEKFRLQGMATHDESIPDFLKEDLLHNDHLSNTDKFKFFGLQNRLRQKAEADAPTTFAFGQVKHQIPEDDLKDKEFVNRFRGALQDQLNLYKQVHQVMPKGQDLQDIASHLLADVDLFRGEPVGPQSPFGSTFLSRLFGGGSARLVEVPVPSDAYKQIETEIFNDKKIKPTPEMIQQVYIARIYQKLYGGAKKESK